MPPDEVNTITKINKNRKILIIVLMVVFTSIFKMVVGLIGILKDRNFMVHKLMEMSEVSNKPKKKRRRSEKMDHERGYKFLFDDFLSESSRFSSVKFIRMYGIKIL